MRVLEGGRSLFWRGCELRQECLLTQKFNRVVLILSETGIPEDKFVNFSMETLGHFQSNAFQIY